jgi:hypothetical protein
MCARLARRIGLHFVDEPIRPHPEIGRGFSDRLK